MKFKIDRRILIIVGGVLILLSLGLLLYFLLSGKEDEPVVPPGSIEQPVGRSDGTEVDIEKDVSDDADINDTGRIYKLDKEGHVENVKQFVNLMGKSSWFERSYGDGYYLWLPSERETFYVIDYDTLTETLTFVFPEPVPVKQFLDGGFLTDDQIDTYMEDLFREYLGLQFKFENSEVIKTREKIEIRSNRIIDDLPLNTRGPESYSDRVEISENGDLVSGKIVLMEYMEPGAEVEIINPGLIGRVINRTDYPKDFHQMAPIGFQVEFPEVDTDDPNYLGDAIEVPESRYVGQIDRCTAKKMDLVYYFFTTDADEVSPTYRIECLGETEIENEEYVVPVVVYTNAIDPDLVFVP